MDSKPSQGVLPTVLSTGECRNLAKMVQPTARPIQTSGPRFFSKLAADDWIPVDAGMIARGAAVFKALKTKYESPCRMPRFMRWQGRPWR